MHMLLRRTAGPTWQDAPAVRSALNSFTSAYQSPDGGRVATLRELKFESRYYSSVIRYDAVLTTSEVKHFFAKLPKVARSRGHESLPPRLPEDVELARLENDAHQFLTNAWPSGPVRFTTPV